MSRPDSPAPEWATLQLRLRRLIRETMRKYQQAYPEPLVGLTDTDSHGSHPMDACTILLPYLAFARWTGDRETRDWLYQWRDAYVHVMQNNLSDFFHGFPEEGEAHHQWEDQSRFLSRLWFLDADDPINAYAVDDAAEHIGNWSPDVPAYYDWERSDFRSYWFGTRYVGNHPGYPEDIWEDATPTPPTGIYREALYRVAQVALNAYFATGKARYLDWSQDFLRAYVKRLETLGAAEDLVNIFTGEGWPRPHFTNYFERNDWFLPDNRFVYGRYVPALLTDLYAITGDPAYAEAARTFLDFCFPGILSFWHQRYFFGLILRYRLTTGDTRYDARLREALEAESAQHGDYDAERYPFHVNGVRALAYTRMRGPMAHSLRYWITGEERYAVQTLRQACESAEVLLRRDAAEYVESFATPHIGGIVDHVLVNPLLNLCGWRPGMQAHHIDVMDIRVWNEAGTEGLPEPLALLRRPAPLSERRFALYNAGDSPVSVRVGAGGLRPTAVTRLTVNGGEFDSDTLLILAPGSLSEIEMACARG